MPECGHCLIEFPESLAVHDRIKGRDMVFCCHGCNGVARLIADEGLEDFYTRRKSSWIPGPPEVPSQDIGLFLQLVRQEGDDSVIDIVLNGIRCASCIWLIERLLQKTRGVRSARVNYATHKARIRWDPAATDIEAILQRIRLAGYRPVPGIVSAAEHEGRRQQRDLLLRFGTAAFFSMQLMMYSVALYAGYFQGISPVIKKVLQVIALVLASPVLFYAGAPFIRGALRGLRNSSFNMDLLIITGAGSAYVYSIASMASGGEVYFDTSAMIITLILLGRFLEGSAKARAVDGITRLMSLHPKEAMVRRGHGDSDGAFVPVPAASVQVSDMVEVRPGDRIPLDGIVSEGSSDVDESMLTGESRPVAKAPGSEVFCGTRNQNGRLVFEVLRTGRDTVLSHIIRTVEEAQSGRAPVQAFADRVVGIFVPVILCISAGTAIAWYYAGAGPATALMNAVSVLVIACPCALGLATPLAILTGTTCAASKGILIRGGEIVERLKDADTVALDKTGTITEGRQELGKFSGIGISDSEALALAAAVERYSGHPASRAILRAAGSMALSDVEDFVSVPGRGVMAVSAGNKVRAGSSAFIEEMGISLSQAVPDAVKQQFAAEELAGATLVYLAVEKRVAGIFSLSDTVRKEARQTVEMLKAQGHDVLIMTGDSIGAAVAAADSVNVSRDRVRAVMSPSEKAGAVKVLQKEGRHVIMAGDGINDAPALIQADAGISMGRATDIALDSADIVLMNNDLRLIPESVKMARRIYRIIRQNLFWAFLYNVVVLPLAVSGMLHPIAAAIAMTLSSLSVAGNSMRLKKA